MKALVLSILAILINTAVFSQDTLYTKSNNVVNAKVLEINQNEIKYKKASNPDGPVYTMSTSDLVFIHFKNGTKEVFSSDNNSSDKVANGSNSGSSNQPTVINNYPVSPAYGRPRVNVMIGGPYWGLTPWWGWGGYYWGGGYYYRPHHFYGSYYNHGGYHGGSYHRGGGGHYGPRH